MSANKACFICSCVRGLKPRLSDYIYKDKGLSILYGTALFILRCTCFLCSYVTSVNYMLTYHGKVSSLLLALASPYLTKKEKIFYFFYFRIVPSKLPASRVFAHTYYGNFHEEIQP